METIHVVTSEVITDSLWRLLYPCEIQQGLHAGLSNTRRYDRVCMDALEPLDITGSE